MRVIAERSVLIRTKAELPVGFKVATEPFRGNWHFMRSGNAQRLEKKIQTHGWNLIKNPEGALRSGVGKTSLDSIASALHQALRQVDAHFNAAEVERIEVSRYPWFFVARVRVYPYRIQQGAEMTFPGKAGTSATLGSNRIPQGLAERFHFGSPLPMLKEMLLSRRGSQPDA